MEHMSTPEKLTDTEWREFQRIPEQGYSHRGWVDWKIAERAEWARKQALREAAERIYDEWPGGHAYEGLGIAWAGIAWAEEWLQALAEGDTE
jgi:hypothetical protein